MEYCEFLNWIQNETKPTAGKGGKVTINHIIKNNGRELDGLVIMEAESKVSPTIYLNEFYEQYIDGRELTEILEEIELIYKENRNRIHISADFFHDYSNIQNTIVYRIVNYDQNQKLLENIPHKRFLDLAVIYYCLLEQKDEGNATALIYNNHIEMWGVTEDDIFQAAVRNTPRLLKSIIRPMSELFNHMNPFEESNMFCDRVLSEECTEKSKLDFNHEEWSEEAEDAQLYVLTNCSKIHGASCMLYDDVLKTFADQIGRDLYILPSSIHEVILLPKLSCFDRNILDCMVKEVNCDGVSRDEILSDHVYEYNRKSGMIEM